MDFKQLASVLRRRWLTIALLVVIALGASTAFNLAATKQYESTTKIFISADVRSAADAYAASLFTAGRVKSYADLATSSDLMNQVIDELDLDLGAGELADQITASVIPETLADRADGDRPRPQDRPEHRPDHRRPAHGVPGRPRDAGRHRPVADHGHGHRSRPRSTTTRSARGSS